MTTTLLNNKTNRVDTHSPQHIFQHQSEPLNQQRPLRGVGQDKARFKSALIDTRQPAAIKKAMRAHRLSSNPPRSQNNSSVKRKAVKVTLWVKPIVKAELERTAGLEGLSVSATGAVFLEQALQQHVDMRYGSLLKPVIEKAIAGQMRSISTRLAWLLVRVAFDAGLLGRQPGVNPDALKTILVESSKSAKANITRRTPQITELMEAVEEWLVKTENK